MFKFIHEDDDFKVTLEIGDNVMTHDKVAEYFTYFLRGCGFVFDHLAAHRLVDSEGDVLPNFEERFHDLVQQTKDRERDEFITSAFDDDAGTFPVI